ncbi:MAG TPA: radical SAM protein [Archangium sp.]|nr:radical SAM protein [Archangium sp.]
MSSKTRSLTHEEARLAIERYLADDDLLRELADEVRAAPRLKSIVVDLTHVCNLRCRGCYFFEEEMDAVATPDGEAPFEHFVERERARGTNFMTVVGGEPALRLDRLKRLHDRFHVLPFTNGVKPISRGPSSATAPPPPSLSGARILRSGSKRSSSAPRGCSETM